MIKILCSVSLIIVKVFSAVEAEDSTLIKFIHLSDSANVETILEKVWLNRSNDPLPAIKLAKQAQVIAEKTGNKSLQAKTDNFLGIVHTNIGANEVALDYHMDALKKSKEASDKIQEAYSYNNIGGIYRIKNEFIPASENILTAINIFEKLKDKTGLAYCFINMGRLYKDQGNFNKSVEYLKNALNLSYEINNEDLRARILLEIAGIMFRKGQFEEAEKTYVQLEKLYEKINYLKGLAEVWHGLSELYYKEKKYYEALKFSNNALELNRKILNTDGEIYNLNNISLIYLSLNMNNKGVSYLLHSLNKAIESNEPDLLINTYKTHYEFYKKTGDLKKSLHYYEKYNHIKDSVYTLEGMIKFGELESLLRIEKAEKENQILQNDLEQQIIQRNYLVTFIILIIIIVIIVTYRFYEKKKLSEELKQTNIVKDKFFSIIAHDLREPYHAIFSAIELLKHNYDDLNEKERKETIDAVGRLIKTDFDLLENLLMWAKNQSSFIEFSPVKLNIKKAINNTLTLFENNINKKNISLHVNCPDNLLINADEQMLNSILRNLIFNSIKFSNTKGKINITAAQINNQTRIEIADNGTGMDEETISSLFKPDTKRTLKGTAGESGSGIGLILTKEFVEKHKGNISVKSKLGEGSKFTINFPAV